MHVVRHTTRSATQHSHLVYEVDEISKEVTIKINQHDNYKNESYCKIVLLKLQNLKLSVTVVSMLNYQYAFIVQYALQQVSPTGQGSKKEYQSISLFRLHPSQPERRFSGCFECQCCRR